LTGVHKVISFFSDWAGQPIIVCSLIENDFCFARKFAPPKNQKLGRKLMKKYIGILAMVSAAVLLLIGCAPAPQATDPASIAKGLFDAINNGRAEAAANYFARDGELITAVGQPKGAEKILFFLKMTLVPLKARVEMKEVKADGENVTGRFTFASTNLGKDAPIPMKLSGVVQAGKIKTMTWSSN
jgi:hypothetical protein